MSLYFSSPDVWRYEMFFFFIKGIICNFFLLIITQLLEERVLSQSRTFYLIIGFELTLISLCNGHIHYFPVGSMPEGKISRAQGSKDPAEGGGCMD